MLYNIFMEKGTTQDPLIRARALHPEWLVAHRRVVRSAGYDSKINLEFAPLDIEMDAILDDYNDYVRATLGGVVIRATES